MNHVRKRYRMLLLAALLLMPRTGLRAAEPSVATVVNAPPPKPAKVEEVILVMKQHYDIGFWGVLPGKGFTRPVTAEQMVAAFKTLHLDQALAAMDKTNGNPQGKRFVWTVPGWVMTQMLDQPPARRQRVVDALKRGQLSTLANPFTLEEEAMELEDVVRGLGFASRLTRELGLPLPVGANMTDVPEHPRASATIYSHAGVKFFRTGINPCSSPPELPMLFWWVGPDGAKTLCMYSPVNYASGAVPPRNWPCKTWLWLDCPGDNVGCRDAGWAIKAVEQLAKARPGVRVRMGTADDFAKAVLAENPDLPVVRQDLGDTWIHGIMAMPIETGLARQLRPRIATLESLDSLLAEWQGAERTATKTVAAAYEKSLLFGEHTWGSWLGEKPRDWKYGAAWEEAWAAGYYRAVDATYREHGDYMRDARALVEPALTEHLAALAKGVNVSGNRIVVFNPLPWKRDAIVEATVTGGVPGNNLQLRDATSRKLIPAHGDGKTIRFRATELPELGYRTYVVSVPATAGAPDQGVLKADAATGVLENRFLRITLDVKRGAIASIIDKRTNRELVDLHAPYGFGQYLYERFSADNIQSYLKRYGTRKPDALCKRLLPPVSQVPYVAASPKEFSLVVSSDPIAATAAMTAKAGTEIPHGVVLKVTLHRDTPYADLEWIINDKRPDLWPEAGWLCLPAKIAHPQFRLSRLLGIVDPSKDICRKSNLDVFCLHSGMTIGGDDHAGIGICPLDSPLVSLGSPGLLHFSTEWTPREPVVFVNLFNNVWGCNYQQWIGGSWSSRVRIWPAEGRGEEATLLTPSVEARNPCLAMMQDGPAGSLPTEQAGIALSRKGVVVTAFGADPDGINKGTLLRVWEQAGNSGELIVTGLKAKTATPVNLRGEATGSSVPIQSGKLTFNLPAYAPASFALK